MQGRKKGPSAVVGKGITVPADPQLSDGPRLRLRRKAKGENNGPAPDVSKTPVGGPLVTKHADKKISKTAFPDRLQWKMVHLRMPTTSTPKLNLLSNSRKVTKRDVETAFGFDDSCNGNSEVEGNYSTLISPISHATPRTVTSAWKTQPLSQKNVEVQVEVSNPSEPQETTHQQTTVGPATRTRASKKRGNPPSIVTRFKSKLKGTKQKPKPPELFEDSTEDVEQNDDGTGVSPFSQLLTRYTEDDKKKTEDEMLRVDPKKIRRTYGSSKRVKISEEQDVEYDYAPIDIPSQTSRKASGRNGKKTVTKSRQKKQADELDEETKRWLAEKNKEFEDILKAPLVIENSFSD